MQRSLIGKQIGGDETRRVKLVLKSSKKQLGDTSVGMSPSFDTKVDGEIEGSAEKLCVDSVKIGKGICLKRKCLDRSQEYVGLESSYKRGIIQRPVSAPEGSPATLKGEELKDGFLRQRYCNTNVRKKKYEVERYTKKNISHNEYISKEDVGEENDNKAGFVRKEVRETLRLYQAMVRKLLQQQELKSKVSDHRSRRADLLAAKILKENNKWVNTGKQILGAVPGVEIGDEFHFRAELAIVGLHHPFQAGIDFSVRSNKLLATSIVAAWCYADDVKYSDVLVYLGIGGNPTGKDKKPEDQKLEGANLSLKNSMDEGTPVRVIRGFKETREKGKGLLSTRGKLVTTYTYDGLYLVEKYWKEKNGHGTDVFKFQLRRTPGQPELPVEELKKSTKTRVLRVDDISRGKETMAIGAVNTIDDEIPPTFEYITNMIYPPWYKLTPPKGCKCKDNCADPTKCYCAVKNGGEIPFNHNGAIVQAKPLVYECGPSCGCPPSCYSRVSQLGIKFQLEIFKTKSRGWGVRSLNSIPSGSFICEYTGELLRDNEAEQRTNNDEYLFDIGRNYNDQAFWEGLSKLMPPDLRTSFSSNTVEDVAFTIDGAQCGNVGRFINHSCSPNLYAQNVLYDHDDKRLPHIMLFAAENIPPLHELTYHYNYVLGQVRDANGNVKKKSCYCGSIDCTKRMY
ncbi:hypothetical protein AQUCO_00100249v1 [Aquilegia coerulea]|uniref:Histone-lysine N-methyltransferase n=1 Tax=Aquilegia coerulea TaxID=218851 RepID=A0A2G5F9P2_AQUCA|nr:hypothetical protein AQUCO_00100249v1 [Aquilegia coerulea]